VETESTKKQSVVQNVKSGAVSFLLLLGQNCEKEKETIGSPSHVKSYTPHRQCNKIKLSRLLVL